jgi:hypothetical protein
MVDEATRIETTQAAVVSLDSGAEVSTTPADSAKTDSRGKGSASGDDEKAEAVSSFNAGVTGDNTGMATNVCVDDAESVEDAQAEDAAQSTASIEANSAAV